ncbi:protein containing AMP-dependent synthetase and ligase [Rhodopirellula maiorica SM1]|uniref:Protein containing AMP-dependent synthetase and ligase n=1 Tax=Rhodopirellula maiorica SM1 TaxID=1265738 RepID=M5RCQ8_9BACT|nr:MupA/Atu3671 family FMN-dependent luciferase-like monooxygenase [Rhodopirellula maiorica]EMI17170.1 protein containing AMP-dependent synthetase and ligase [Rhodopirellula maiorica SM1]
MTQPHSAFLLGDRLLVVQCAETLLARGFRIAAVASSHPEVLQWARDQGIACVDPRSSSHALADAAAAAAPFDFLLSITYLQMIPRDVIALASRMAINFHDSYLPQYAGLNSTAWAIAANEPRHGITWHVLTDQPDTGDIVLQVPIELASDETSLTLNTKCFEAATDSFDTLVDRMLDRSFCPTPQDLGQRSYFSRDQRFHCEGWIDTSASAIACDAVVRALDFGDRFENPLALPKIRYRNQWWITRSADVMKTPSTAAPGTIIAVESDAIVVATQTRNLRLGSLRLLNGERSTDTHLADAFVVGELLDALSTNQQDAINDAAGSAAKHQSFWIERLAKVQPLSVSRDASTTEPGSPEPSSIEPSSTEPASTAETCLPISVPAGWGVDDMIAAFGLFLSRISGNKNFDVAFYDSSPIDSSRIATEIFAAHRPLKIDVVPEESFANHRDNVRTERDAMERHGGFAADLPLRYPAINHALLSNTASIHVIDSVAESSCCNFPLSLRVTPDGSDAVLRYRLSELDDRWAWAISRLPRFIAGCEISNSQPVQSISLLSKAEEQQILVERNHTDRDYNHSETIDRAIVAQSRRTPQATALVDGTQQWTYQQLAAEIDRLAAYFQSKQIGEGDLVGIATTRSLGMVAAIVAVMKTGAAYVPLDLEFPSHRIELMIRDAGLRCILVDQLSRARVPKSETETIDIGDVVAPQNETKNPGTQDSASKPSNRAYVIYTSGSTGRPKGVMVTHQNVINFFAGMDDLIPHDPAGTWLAVTSLSFDISVLELLWTLARGFKVVLHDTPSRIASTAKLHRDTKPIDFGLFYFSSSANQSESPYQLLMEGARFADAHDFSSVWTPERHFHDFGGLYPNPSVTSAAVAAVTRRIAIRSGSVVLPLHHPARVTEEWSVVDQISQGRVGISFASGWQPNDFIFAPENYANAKTVMLENIDLVRRLWRGETVEFAGHDGKPVTIQTYPRPLQQELPVWVTTAGNEATFQMAGSIGANILTHLLGQTIEELTARIEAYRDARAKAGHEGPGEVTVMVHTFVGDSNDEVRELVRKPLTEYLRTSASLLKGFSHTWAAFKKRTDGTTVAELDLDKISDAEMDDLLAFSFERYFQSSGLFGTPDKCLDLVRKLHGAGVTEIACLIDFGVAADVAYTHLKDLDSLRLRAQSEIAPPPVANQSISELVRQHGVTHLQCTPSMAQMLFEDDDTRTAITSIPHLMLGGEALPGQLAEQILATSSARLVNVYGPTETTVWSTSKVIDQDFNFSGSIGKPIANTRIYILDDFLQPLPDGVAGNLWIGGDGVAAGYLRQDDLTADRFRPDPFSSGDGGRMYNTGDLARWNADGEIEFLGRSDFQLKIRGHRIELQEIENAIDTHPMVRQSVVVADPNATASVELVAYVVLKNTELSNAVLSNTGAKSIVPSEDLKSTLRDSLRKTLPSHMIPSRWVCLNEFPLTPNGKIDRKALPRWNRDEVISSATKLAAAVNLDATQQKLETIWCQTLQLDSIQLDDNFFDLGGHSLLAVRAHRMLKDQLSASIVITDLFRFPTIRTLSQHIDAMTTNQGSDSPSPPRVSAGQSRASRRKALLGKRREERST